MKKILHIISTPRGEESRTLKVSSVFLDAFKKKNPGCAVEEINVCTEKLPELTVKRLDGKYALLGGKELSGEIERSWEEIVKYIKQFLSADAYLVSTTAKIPVQVY
jgi:FMN-dependent NADH-azoreductase